MCLGVPGRVVEIKEGVLAMGRVAFGAIMKEVCLAYVPEAAVGDYVVVHAGFAISRIDEEAAARVLDLLEQTGAAELGEEPR